MAEQIARRLVQHELAVEKDPKHPEYGGLGSLLAGTTEEKGRVAVVKFTKWVSERQQQRAQILKQARLLREEKAADAKRRKGKGKGKNRGKDEKDADEEWAGLLRGWSRPPTPDGSEPPAQQAV